MSIKTTLIVVSDRAASGERADETADALRPVLDDAGFELTDVRMVADNPELIRSEIQRAALSTKTPLILTTGGTGVSARDVTPDVTREVVEYEIPGLAEEMRRRSVEKTIHALGSRATAGALEQSIVLNLPGRPTGAVECFGFVAGALPHLVDVRSGPVSDESHGAQDA